MPKKVLRRGENPVNRHREATVTAPLLDSTQCGSNRWPRHGSGPDLLRHSSSGEPAKDRISLLTLCATSNDSATADGSSSPSPQVAVIIACCANFWGSPAKDAALSQRRNMVAESTAFT